MTAPPMNDVGLVKTIDRLNQNGDVAAADIADRRLDPSLGQSFRIAYPTPLLSRIIRLREGPGREPGRAVRERLATPRLRVKSCDQLNAGLMDVRSGMTIVADTKRPPASAGSIA